MADSKLASWFGERSTRTTAAPSWERALGACCTDSGGLPVLGACGTITRRSGLFCITVLLSGIYDSPLPGHNRTISVYTRPWLRVQPPRSRSAPFPRFRTVPNIAAEVSRTQSPRGRPGPNAGRGQTDPASMCGRPVPRISRGAPTQSPCNRPIPGIGRAQPNLRATASAPGARRRRAAMSALLAGRPAPHGRGQPNPASRRNRADSSGGVGLM
jgi:hypothetical protein